MRSNMYVDRDIDKLMERTGNRVRHRYDRAAQRLISQAYAK